MENDQSVFLNMDSSVHFPPASAKATPSESPSAPNPQVGKSTSRSGDGMPPMAALSRKATSSVRNPFAKARDGTSPAPRPTNTAAPSTGNRSTANSSAAAVSVNSRSVTSNFQKSTARPRVAGSSVSLAPVPTSTTSASAPAPPMNPSAAKPSKSPTPLGTGFNDEDSMFLDQSLTVVDPDKSNVVVPAAVAAPTPTPTPALAASKSQSAAMLPSAPSASMPQIASEQLAFQRERDSAQRKVASLEAELAVTKDLHARERTTADQWKAQADQTSQELAAARKELFDVKEAAEADREARAGLVRRSTCDALGSQVSSLEATVASLQQEVEERAKEIGKLGVDADFAKSERDAANHEMNELRTRMEAKNAELNAAREDLAAAQQAQPNEEALAEMQRAHEAAVAAIEGRHAEEVRQLNEAMVVKDSEIAQAQEALRALEESATAQRDELDQARQETAKLQEKIANEAAEFERRLEQQREDADGAIKQAVGDAHEKVEELQRELSSKTADLASATNTLDAKLEELMVAQNAARDFEELATELKAKIAALDEEASAAVASRAAVEAELKATNAKLGDLEASQNAELRDAVDDLAAKLVLAEQQHEDATKELQEQLDSATTSATAAEGALAEKVAEWSKVKMDLMTSEGEIRSELAVKTRELDELQRIKGDDAACQDALKKQVEDAEAAHESTKAAFAAKEEELLDAKTANGDLRTEIETLKSQIRVLRLDSGSSAAPVRPSPAPLNPTTAAAKKASESPVSSTLSSLPPRSGKTARPLTDSTNRDGSDLPQKRSRNCTMMRRFSLTGVDKQRDFAFQIGTIDGAIMEKTASNSSVSDNVTHILSGGQLTVKLLSGLVKGCWIMPVSYLDKCLETGEWLDEATNGGFRHSVPPLKGKRIGFTETFRNTSRFTTSSEVVKAGWAEECSELDQCDILLGSSAEARENANCMSFDSFIRKIQPVTVQ